MRVAPGPDGKTPGVCWPRNACPRHQGVFVTQNFISFLGLFVLIGLAWLISEDRKRFPTRVVVWGLILQLGFGFLVLKWEPGERFFSKLNDVFNALLSFSTEGAKFIFA